MHVTTKVGVWDMAKQFGEGKRHTAEKRKELTKMTNQGRPATLNRRIYVSFEDEIRLFG